MLGIVIFLHIDIENDLLKINTFYVKYTGDQRMAEKEPLTLLGNFKGIPQKL